MEDSTFSRFILDPQFSKVLEDLSLVDLHAAKPVKSDIEIKETNTVPNENEKVGFIEDKQKVALDPSAAQTFVTKNRICAYDESLVRISALEGTGFFVSHSVVLMEANRYLPLIYLTFNFYTKSRRIADGSNSLHYTPDSPELGSKIQYLNDRKYVLTSFVPNHSFLLIDGPLIGGQISEYNLQLNDELLKKEIVPIFFVKNSESSLVVGNDSELKGQYNSDFDWAFHTLNQGERTAFVKYTDLTDSKRRRNKVFTYIKALKAPPVRIEMHDSTYAFISSKITKVMDMLYYLLLAQGNALNSQPRPIAVAEAYARESLKVVDFDQVVRKAGIQPTMNYTRFGW